MPYIKADEREWVAKTLEELAKELRLTSSYPGMLNYVISATMNNILREIGLNYIAANALVGCLDCAKMELYRRVVAPYEDQKRRINGDVYDPTLTGER